jgi:hypothetical protein
VKITEVAKNNWDTFSTVTDMWKFSEKWIELHFGQLFQKRIWSPCPR